MVPPNLKLSLLCALTAVALSPVRTFAAPLEIEQAPRRVVNFADLDLNQKAGVITLYSRIRSAARHVCEPLDLMGVKLLHERSDCRQEAVARAVAEVNSPALTDYSIDRVNRRPGASPK